MIIGKKVLLIAAACVVGGTAQARPVTLTCTSSVDLYAQPYTVVVNAKALTVQISKSGGPLAGRRSYRITQADSASDGGYVVTASGSLPPQIQIMVSPQEKWVEYLDAFTDRPYATDYCS